MRVGPVSEEGFTVESNRTNGMIQRAVEEEREACASLIEEQEVYLPDRVRNAVYVRGTLAALIRARGTLESDVKGQR
mgnify:CR=1 FL=1